MTLPDMSVIDTPEAEREACAKVCEDIARKYQKLHHPSAENVADECAAAIRERNQA